MPTPVKDQFFQELEQYMESVNCTSYYLVNGVTQEESSDEEDFETERKGEKEERDLTQDQVENELRIVLLNVKRAKALKHYLKFANPDDGFFNTTTGNMVIEQIEPEIDRIKNKKSTSDKFDFLFALTANLNDYADCWMEDNEMTGEGEEMETSIRKLGKTWKSLLVKTNDELGIDEKYSRPGIERLLDQFKAHCDLQYEMGTIETRNIFKWK